MEKDVLKEIENGSRLGIMGGTFDPIHYGHLVAAENARIAHRLDHVLFIPTGISPHKLDFPVSDAWLRYEMVKISVRSNRCFQISRIEIDRSGPSYTIDTLKTIHQIWPKQELYLITGSDAVTEITTWREPEEIIRMAKIVSATRPGYDSRDLLEQIYQKYPVARGRIFELEIPALDISSTDIRTRVRQGRPIRYLVPEEVLSFIKKKSLYSD